MKSLIKYLWVFALLLGIIALVLFLLTPALNVSNLVETLQGKHTGSLLIFGETDLTKQHGFYVVIFVLVLVSILSAFLGLIKHKIILLGSALLFIATGILLFCLKSISLSIQISDISTSILQKAATDLFNAKYTGLGVGPILSGILLIFAGLFVSCNAVIKVNVKSKTKKKNSQKKTKK